MSASVGCGLRAKKRRSGHDLARVAVGALNDLAVEPGLLHLGTRRCRADGLDRGDLGSANALDRAYARARGSAANMHGYTRRRAPCRSTFRRVVLKLIVREAGLEQYQIAW
jgi:hypothetical protein